MAALPAGCRLVVAFSGGLDSTVLLHLLARLAQERPLSLAAFHLHHGLSRNADQWQAHCASACQSLGVAFFTERADLAQFSGDGVEARARAARYAHFAALAADIVALAHHRDDQAETVLYRLARGAGVHGAAAMPAWRLIRPGLRLWRPLLGESRQALLRYAKAQQLRWVDDESNADTAYDRNYLRHELMPRLTARFAAADEALARAAAHFADAADLLDQLAVIDAGDMHERLPLARLLPLDVARQRNLLRWFLSRHQLRPESQQIEMLRQQFLTARPDAMPCLRIGRWEIRRYRDEIWLSTVQAAAQPQRVTGDVQPLPDWHGELSWRRQPGGLSSDSLAQLELRPRLGGELIYWRGMRRQVKHLLQEAGIPPWLRACWPLLWRDQRLVAIAGLLVDSEFQQDAAGCFPLWRPAQWGDVDACLARAGFPAR